MRRSGERGLTLLEMMLVVAVAGVILAIGIPSLRQFILNNRITGVANELLSAAHMARTESIKRHVQTVLCFSATPDAAAPACNGDGRQGWIVFVDDADPNAAAASDNNGQFDPGEEIVVRHGAIADGIAIRTSPSGNAGYLAYNAAGFSREITAVGEDFESVVLCDNRGNTAAYGAANSTARALVMSATGRPAVTRVVSEIAAVGGCS